MAEKILLCRLNDGESPPFAAFGANSLTPTEDIARLKARLPAETFLYAHALSADGRYLAVCTSPAGFQVIDLQTMAQVPVSGVSGTIFCNAIAWSPDGTRLAIGMGGSPFLRVFNMTAGGSSVTVTNAPDSIQRLAWSPDGTRLAAGSVSNFGTNTVWMYNTTTWTYSTPAVRPDYAPQALAWSPSGATLAAGFSQGTYYLRAWTAASWAVVTIADLPAHTVERLAWSPNGTWLAAASVGTSLTAYATATWAKETIPSGPTGIVRGMAWKPDSSALWLGYNAGAFRIESFNPTTWAKSTPAGAPSTTLIQGMDFTAADMRRVAAAGAAQILDDAGAPAAGRVVRVFDRATGDRISQKTTDASGQFSVPFFTAAPVDVQVLDDDAGTVYADLHFTRVAPAVTP